MGSIFFPYRPINNVNVILKNFKNLSQRLKFLPDRRIFWYGSVENADEPQIFPTQLRPMQKKVSGFGNIKLNVLCKSLSYSDKPIPELAKPYFYISSLNIHVCNNLLFKLTFSFWLP